MVSESECALFASYVPVTLESAEMVGPEWEGRMLLWTRIAGGLGAHAIEHWAQLWLHKHFPRTSTLQRH